MRYMHTLRELRDAYGYRPEDLAAALGVSPALVRTWEVGQAAPEAHHRRDLARLFTIPVEQLTFPPPAPGAAPPGE